jgi:hypothetical protein
LIGIDTPETKRPGVPVECGGPEASESLRELVQGRAVTLTPDPTQDAVDRYGRSLFYIDRDDGLDVGREQVRRGWADIYYFQERDFQRSSLYEAASDEASRSERGVWGQCYEDFHNPLARLERESAKAFVRLYYRRLSNDQYRTAWGMLGARRKAQVRPFWRWKAGYRGSLGVSVLAARARLAGPRRAVVTVRLRSRDRDVCNGRTVRQRWYGNVILASKADSWTIIKFQIRKTAGAKPRLSKAECPPPRTDPVPVPPVDPDPGGGCHPSYTPCVPDVPGDLDCADVGHAVTVIGPDEYGLDGNSDGTGCEEY